MRVTAGERTSSERMARFCSHLQHFGEDPLRTIAEIEQLYARDLVFVDPLGELSSRDEFVRMQRRFLAAMREIRFVVKDVLEGTDTAFVTTTLTIRPRLGPRLALEAASHLRFAGSSVVYQRDYFDPLSSLLAASPRLVRVRSWIADKLR